jgi:hypothetical protein
MSDCNKINKNAINGCMDLYNLYMWEVFTIYNLFLKFNYDFHVWFYILNELGTLWLFEAVVSSLS